jgi:hypothetical protein
VCITHLLGWFSEGKAVALLLQNVVVVHIEDTVIKPTLTGASANFASRRYRLMLVAYMWNLEIMGNR